VNSLPKTVARQRRDCDLNPRPSAPESSTLTTRLPSHPCRRTRAENSRDPGGLWAFDHQTIDTDRYRRCHRAMSPSRPARGYHRGVISRSATTSQPDTAVGQWQHVRLTIERSRVRSPAGARLHDSGQVVHTISLASTPTVFVTIIWSR